MTAVERDFLDGPLLHHLADGHRRGFDQRRRAGDGHVLRNRRHAQLHVDDGDLRDLQLDIGGRIPEAFEMRHDRVAARREGRGHVLAGGVADDDALGAGPGVLDADCDAGHDRTLRISDGSLDRGRGLRVRRPGRQEHDGEHGHRN